MIPAAVWILCAVFILIIVRRIGKFRLPVWLIMTLGAAAALVSFSISPLDALFSINIDVIVFLFGMFIVGAALDKSGLLDAAASRAFIRARTKKEVLLIFILLAGLSAAIFMNDTTAVIGTPVALYLAKRYAIPVKKLLIALCFAVTFGSAATPVGNPQNLLVALSGGVPFAFGSFALYLLVPSLICLLFVWWFMARGLDGEPVEHPAPSAPCDEKLARVCKVSIAVICALILLRIILSCFDLELPFMLIAVCGAVPVLLCSRRRFEVLKAVDYATLLFFVSMFIVMAAVWNSGFIQEILPAELVTSVPLMIGAGCLVSQFVSNVPFILMALPLLNEACAELSIYMASVAGTTCAGTLTILGAASTIIVLQHAEKEGESFSFIEYLKPGIVVTLFACIVYAGWILFTGLF
ncbi:MAG TPA: SLC13 family permease [Methanocorpusculum sp.]|nr:SLC13 family permease [Methanocorpusculum sp.]